MLPTGTTMEEAVNEKIDGGRWVGLGHQVNS
jgi:hypothetical protein